MSIFDLVTTVILVTASGALAPGPLFFATVSHGARSGAKSGLVFSIAHTLVEFVLVMILAGGLLTVADTPVVKLTVGVVGGSALTVFGSLQVRSSFNPKFGESKHGETVTRNLLLVGLAFTGLNPFFIVWWLSAGAELILLSLEFASLAGVVIMYVCHVWIDYVWLISVAHFAKIGMNITGFRWYRATMAVFGAVLIYFGVAFLISSFNPI